MIVGVLCLLAAFATAGLGAAALALPSAVSTLLAAYVLYLAETTFVVLVLSPLREVDRGGIAVVEALLLAASAAAWWRAGRPGPDLEPARRAVAAVARDPVMLAFCLLVLCALAYELVLGLTVPANEYDSLSYHLVRAAAWTQQHGYGWVANAPYDPINNYGPVAELGILFAFATVGNGLLYALPQYLAELAALVAVYGSARRLGYGVRPSAAAASLLATFGLVALESTTAQNDLVAGSCAIVAACLLLGSSSREHALAGVAVGLALGVKLTILLVLPVLVALALLRGRRASGYALAGAVVAFVALGMWVFVLNLIHTGSVLGPGGRAGNAASPGYPQTLVTALQIAYVLLDLAALSDHAIRVLEYTGILAGLGVAAYALARLRRRRPGRALAAGAAVAVPFLAPLIVIGAGDVMLWIGRETGHPLRGPYSPIGPITRFVNAGESAFGPLGIVALVAAALLTLLAGLRRRASRAEVALAAALPVCLVLLAAESSFNVYLPRFFVAAVALTAPLLARLLGGRFTRAAYLAVGATVLALTITQDRAKPLHGQFGHPWQMTQLEALEIVEPRDAPMLAAYDRLVPPHSCVGAVLGGDEPAYLLFGPHLGRHVAFLPAPFYPTGQPTVEAAYARGVSYVVLSSGLPVRLNDGVTLPTPENLATLPGQFRAAGWHLHHLGWLWTLAIAPRVVSGPCSA